MTPLLSLHPRSPGICGGQFGLRCEMTSHNIDSPCWIQSTWHWEACKLKSKVNSSIMKMMMIKMINLSWEAQRWLQPLYPNAIYVFTSMSILWNTWQEYSSPLLARPRRNWLRCAKVLSMQRIFLRGHKYFPHSDTASSFTCAPPPAPASSSEQPAWH